MDSKLGKNYPPDCSCKSCQGKCERRPGWFLPGEAEKAAALKGLSLEEFFKRYLAVDWWEGSGDREILIISPANTSITSGKMFSQNPIGQCIFLKEGLCDIHEAKPYECKSASCSSIDKKSNEDVYNDHKAVAKSWIQHQEQVKSLLKKTNGDDESNWEQYKEEESEEDDWELEWTRMNH